MTFAVTGLFPKARLLVRFQTVSVTRCSNTHFPGRVVTPGGKNNTHLEAKLQVRSRMWLYFGWMSWTCLLWRPHHLTLLQPSVAGLTHPLHILSVFTWVHFTGELNRAPSFHLHFSYYETEQLFLRLYFPKWVLYLLYYKLPPDILCHVPTSSNFYWLTEFLYILKILTLPVYHHDPYGFPVYYFLWWHVFIFRSSYWYFDSVRYRHMLSLEHLLWVFP